MDTEIGRFMNPEVAMQRRKFSREFKFEAVKLVRDGGVSVAQAAREESKAVQPNLAALDDKAIGIGNTCLADEITGGRSGRNDE